MANITFKTSSFEYEFMMAALAAGISKTAAAPIERIKLILQSQPELIKSGRLQRNYAGILDCFKRVVRQEGALSLWRGNSLNIIRYFPTQMVHFSTRDHYSKIIPLPKNTLTEKIISNVAAGVLAGASLHSVVYSLDYTRTRLANDIKKNGERQYKGIFDVYKKTLKSDGIVGLYRGFTISILGVGIYRGIYLGMYDSLKPILYSNFSKNTLSFGLATFGLAWATSLSASLICYPLDTKNIKFD